MSLRQLDSDPLAPVVEPGAPLPPIMQVATGGAGLRRRSARRENIGLWICLAWIGLVIVCAVGAAWFPGVKAPNAIDPFNRLKGPTASHPFGTDELGRDIFSRVL